MYSKYPHYSLKLGGRVGGAATRRGRKTVSNTPNLVIRIQPANYTEILCAYQIGKNPKA